LGVGARSMVTGIDIGKYDGDFEDVAAFSSRVWTDAYRGKMWFPLWDANFLRGQYGLESQGLSFVARSEGDLAGTLLSVRHELRIAQTVHPVGLLSWCTVDPRYRHLSVIRQLIETYRQLHDEQKLAFTLAIVSGEPASLGYRFWQQYSRAFPEDFQFLFRFGSWVKILAPTPVIRAGIGLSERLQMRAAAPLQKLTPFRPGSNVRRYATEDLQVCAQLLQKTCAGFDWALVWSQQRLAAQLHDSASHTLVFDRGKGVQGFVNFHCLFLQGSERINAGLIDLWADVGLSLGDRIRLLSAVCHDLRDRGVHMIFAMRSAMMPASAFAANLFLPFASKDHLIVMFQRGRQLPLPRTWSLLLR
jgi:hypothetical protein